MDAFGGRDGGGGAHRQHRWLTVGLMPDAFVFSGDICLIKVERKKLDVPCGAGAQSGDDMVVKNVRERAAVVEVQSKAEGTGRTFWRCPHGE